MQKCPSCQSSRLFASQRLDALLICPDCQDQFCLTVSGKLHPVTQTKATWKAKEDNGQPFQFIPWPPPMGVSVSNSAALADLHHRLDLRSSRIAG